MALARTRILDMTAAQIVAEGGSNACRPIVRCCPNGCANTNGAVLALAPELRGCKPVTAKLVV